MPRTAVVSGDDRGTRITLRIRPALKRAIAVRAAERGTTVMSLVEELLLRDPDVAALAERYTD